ncbi:MAG: hypothetical protein VKQ33_12115 [Candidatus Sericytochromatia bacterium]|nr:hypothetical protein [Candidatus Sericytochromatia bacterium]
MHRIAWHAALVALWLAGCSEARGGRLPIPVPSPPPPPNDLGALVGQAEPPATEEGEVRELLRRPVAVVFPARLGLLFYGYEPPVLDEERLRIVDQLNAGLVASGLARQASAIPAVLGRGVGLEGLRRLAARLQLDGLVLVGGRSRFERSELQPGGFFAAFGSGANFEARTTLTAFTLDVRAGTLLTPASGAGATPPTLLDPTLPSFVPERRRLVREAFSDAVTGLGQGLQAGLREARDAQAAAAGD